MNNTDSLILTKKDFVQTGSVREIVRQYTSRSKDTYDLRVLRNEFEKNVICDVLKMTHGNKQRAAKMLGISRTVLYEKLKLYVISDR